MRWRLGISVGFLIPLMYVAMYHMYNEWFGLPIPHFVHRYLHGDENAMTFALTQFILLLPILYMNRKFFSVGFRTLRHLSPNMDSLIALGASAAIGYGIFAMYRIAYGLGHGAMEVVEHYSHDLYFESAGMILTLLAGHAWLAMGGIFLMGFGFAPIYPAMLHATPVYFGADQSQQVMGLEMAFAYVGSTCFPPLFGALTTYFGTAIYPVFLLMCAALAIAAAETTNICFEGKEKTGKTEEKML